MVHWAGETRLPARIASEACGSNSRREMIRAENTLYDDAFHVCLCFRVITMNRRTARLTREYLYRKSLEGKEKELYEKKQRIRSAIERNYIITA